MHQNGFQSLPKKTKTDEVLHSLLRGNRVCNSLVESDEERDKYNNNSEQLLKRISLITDDESEYLNYEKWTREWLMPIEYKSLDVLEYVVDKCTTDMELVRVAEEYVLYEKHDLIDALRFIIYMVDTFRDRNIVWGVGRGSSVSSYILYLIGLHKVDSLKYELDIHEFLRE